jgi:hypothetical protein
MDTNVSLVKFAPHVPPPPPTFLSAVLDPPAFAPTPLLLPLPPSTPLSCVSPAALVTPSCTLIILSLGSGGIIVITQYAEPVSISRGNLPAYPHPSNGSAAAREGVLYSENSNAKLASILQKRGGTSEGRDQRQHRENGVSVFEVDDYAPFSSQSCVDDCVRQIAQGIRHTSHATRHTSHVTRHTSHVTRHTSHATRHTSHVTRHTSHVTRHTSHATRHTSHVTRHTPHVTRHTSHVTRHTSHVTRHTSHVTRHTSHVTRHVPHATRHTPHVTHRLQDVSL